MAEDLEESLVDMVSEDTLYGKPGDFQVVAQLPEDFHLSVVMPVLQAEEEMRLELEVKPGSEV